MAKNINIYEHDDLKALELCLNIPFILWFNRCALVGPDEPDSEKQ